MASLGKTSTDSGVVENKKLEKWLGRLAKSGDEVFGTTVVESGRALSPFDIVIDVWRSCTQARVENDQGRLE